MDKLVAIVGPTAVGKTKIASELALRLGAQIISCDSMQIYRGMDIGTAKATPAEQQKVIHHMIDIVEPDENYSVADYQKQAQQIIADLNKKNCLPLLVGGTGLYYQALVDNYTFYPMESRQEIRDKWQEIINKKGLDYAYNYLQTVDPHYAAKISNQDQKRIIRGIEVYEITGKPFSYLQKKSDQFYDLCVFGFYLERNELYQRINQRVDEMLAQGLVEEVISLRAKGYGPELNSMQALGYKQVLFYLDGFLTKEEMVNEIKRETRHFAKRQITWFKKDQRIQWLNVSKYNDLAQLVEKIANVIEGRLPAV